jgi:hypothetical protein
VSVEFYWIAVAVVTIVSASRLTRLATWDEFPPIKVVRNRYADWTEKKPKRQGWQLVAFCGYCFSFWATAFVVIWADLAGVLDGKPAFGWTGDLSIPLWWIVNGIFAASYLAAILMAHDGDEGDN